MINDSARPDRDDPARLTWIDGLSLDEARNGFSDARARRWPSCEGACRAIARASIYPAFRLKRTSEWPIASEWPQTSLPLRKTFEKQAVCVCVNVTRTRKSRLRKFIGPSRRRRTLHHARSCVRYFSTLARAKIILATVLNLILFRLHNVPFFSNEFISFVWHHAIKLRY